MKNAKFINILSGTLLIGGTMVGAGMLGIPLVTGQAGFFPAILMTAIVWLFMFLTGLLFLETTLWMHKGANVISMSLRFLGQKGKVVSAITFIFLYYCLMVAYFAAGSPILAATWKALTGLELGSWHSFALFGLIFGFIVWLGLKYIDRLNYILMVALVLSYAALIGAGVDDIQLPRLYVQNWKQLFWAAPVLFTAFGYHNVIPSLTLYFKNNGKVMRYAIFGGTILSFIIYVIWQWLIMGSLPQDLIASTLQKGETVTAAMQMQTGNLAVKKFSQLFSFFAIVTSVLGVSFSMVDFLGDGLGLKRKGMDRFLLCLLTFIPPFLITSYDPSIFVLAIGIAGGFGEAFLNGILPTWMVWIGRYKRKLQSEFVLFGGKILLTILILAAIFVAILEGVILYHEWFV